MKFQQVHLRLNVDTYKKVKVLAKENEESVSETLRILINDGLACKVTEENTDIIAVTVRQQLEIVLKPHIERLAALSSKSGHMSASAAFLNVQALMDLVPTERRKDVIGMYNSARKKAVAYMGTKVNDEGGLYIE